MRNSARALAFLAALLATTAPAAETLIDDGWRHLRNAEPREWAEFPEEPAARRFERVFEARRNERAATLLVRQQDVKQAWRVLLNGDVLGTLVRDEIDLVASFEVPPSALVEGENRLVIEGPESPPDDVRIGHVALHEGTGGDVFGASVRVRVVDRGTERATPCRITILDERGARAALHVEPSSLLAVRPGVVYSGTGEATIGLVPGRYTMFAGRGFEYGRDERTIEVRAGMPAEVELAIERDVDTAGWIACDTHVHTLTESGHGDSTLEERMVTIAGEGIEFPIATEHNKHSDYGPTALRLGLRRWFTPVVGNEVTTKVGHFNVFPVRPGAPPPDHTPLEWVPIFDNVFATPGVRAVVLNHARDLHSGVRPFGPDRHLSLVGRNLDGWELRANAMEIVNSGAQQTDPLQLVRDWFGLLNAGKTLTPVGASDSHDVARHFVGQGRTYIRARDEDPGAIDVDAAVDAFLEGRVLVSCGMLVTIEVDGAYGPGDLVPAERSHVVVSDIRHPEWITHDRYELFRNGRPLGGVETRSDSRGSSPGGTMRTESSFPAHDVWLAAIATGPGVRHASWPIAKPYQPASPAWEPRVLGSTGAVFVDGDGDGVWTSPRGYAERVLGEDDADRPTVVGLLAAYDEAVASQAASLLHERGLDPLSAEFRELVRDAPQHVRTGFEEYATAWRASVLARAGG